MNIYYESIYTLSMSNHVFIHICLIIGWYTVYILRCNLTIQKVNSTFIGIISTIINNPNVIPLLLIIFVFAYAIRYYCLINFSNIYEYITLFYCIILCIWMPSKLIFNIIIMVYTQMFYISLKQFKQEFNVND